MKFAMPTWHDVSYSQLNGLSTVMHRAEIPRADHIKGILARTDATSGDDVTLLKTIENLTLQQPTQ